VAEPAASYAVVIVDNAQRGGLELLKGIRAAVVAEMRYLNARDATTLYGTGFLGGVITVTTLSKIEPDTSENHTRSAAAASVMRDRMWCADKQSEAKVQNVSLPELKLELYEGETGPCAF